MVDFTVEREKIIQENLKLYRLESQNYISLHPEIYNWFEQGEIQKDLASLKKKLKGNEALDIGCGMGNISLKLLSLGFKVTAIDISTTMIKKVKRALPVEIAINLDIIETDIDTFLSKPAGKYNLVTMSSVLHHIPEYLESLQNIFGFIAVGGFLYITHEPLKDVLTREDPLLRKLLWQIDYLCYLIKKKGRIEVINGVDWRLSDYHLYKGLDHDGVRRLLKKNGFKVFFRKYSSNMRLGISNWIDTNLLRTESQFKIIAKKTYSEINVR
jgi:ubiquinone/menaquinone biosynthesis C-methylase UbiE